MLKGEIDMERKYEAYADNGRDFITFDFYSTHRANSKANIEDAKREYRLKHGHSIKVINTYRSFVE